MNVTSAPVKFEIDTNTSKRPTTKHRAGDRSCGDIYGGRLAVRKVIIIDDFSSREDRDSDLKTGPAESTAKRTCNLRKTKDLFPK